MTLTESVIAQNIIHPVLEIFFKAEIRFLKQGQLPVDASGNALTETEFKSTWLTPNKLIRDFHDTIACQLWSTLNPDIGCVFWIRDNGTLKQDDKNFTHFNYAVDTRGYESGAYS
ncbi:hypothetical protein pEaSNUABM52_00225 [Erwinia phage pEp_SNUABM_52]|nr:hypothetical protein pEaSNUABM52_00225 [Erwinia phage pEp_SNUABM_52]